MQTSRLFALPDLALAKDLADELHSYQFKLTDSGDETYAVIIDEAVQIIVRWVRSAGLPVEVGDGTPGTALRTGAACAGRVRRCSHEAPKGPIRAEGWATGEIPL
jgi:hypothetical protein